MKFILSNQILKKRQATHIAPLQPLILAAFRPWGGSAGAGRVRPAGRKYKGKLLLDNYNLSGTKKKFII